jgi:hypothetical protein
LPVLLPPDLVFLMMEMVGFGWLGISPGELGWSVAGPVDGTGRCRGAFPIVAVSRER